MMHAYVLCGLPGSGKSTWAKNMVMKDSSNKTVIVNKDMIREMLLGKYDYMRELENLVQMIAHVSAWEALDRGYDVIIDECHITKEKRKTALAQFVSRKDISISVVYFTENKKNLEYRMLSPRGMSATQWSDVIDSMRSNFEPPTEEELGSEIELLIDP